MTSEGIYDALTDIREDFIMEAKEKKLKKSHKPIMRWCIMAASFVLVLGIGSYILINSGLFPAPGGSMGGGGSGSTHHDDGSTEFLSYAGPVFPLTILNDTGGITASRNIVFDFSGFGNTRTENELPLQHSDISINDSYALTNNTTSDITAKILYPFAGNFSDLHKVCPVIKAGGNSWNVKLDTELKAGTYSGGFIGTSPDYEHMAINMKPINSWDNYITLLSDGEYLKRAMGDTAELGQTVTVYEFTNVWADHGKAVAPTLAACFNLDYDRTTVLTYGFNGGTWDIENGYMRRSFFVPREGVSIHNSSYYMIVVGDDIDNLVIQGYENGGCHEGEEMDEATADVTRYEAVLGDILAILLNDYMEMYGENNKDEWGYSVESLDMAMLYRAATELLRDYGVLSDSPAFRYDTGELVDVFSEMLVMDRVFFLTAEIAIPAGESTLLSADMVKKGSYDFYGSGSGNVGIYGYDMLTRLNSNLIFDETTAGISGEEYIDIVRQNFGFDPANGILSVVLEPETPHYYIEVRDISEYSER